MGVVDGTSIEDNTREYEIKQIEETMKNYYSIENGAIHPALKKNVKIDVSDIDNTARKVKAYFSIFNIKDYDGDIVDPNAFKKTIKERGPAGSDEIAHLKNHYLDQTPGRIIELGTDEKGAFFVSKIAATTLGNDTLIEYQEGIIKQHSFGYEIVAYRSGEDVNYLTELKLYEVSTLSFLGANPFTSVISISKNIKTIEDYCRLIDVLTKYLQNGQFSDELLLKLGNLHESILKLDKFALKPNLSQEPPVSTLGVAGVKTQLTDNEILWRTICKNF
jgi:HK97 family phage prohead protease